MARTSSEESERTERAILRAAVAEMARHGFAGLRIPKVAKAIGKTQGAIYGRFADKEALALAALGKVQEDHFGPLILAALSSDAPPLEALQQLSLRLAGMGSEEPEAQRMIGRLAAEAVGETGAVPQAVRALLELFTQAIAELLTRAQALGQVAAELDTRAFALTSVGAQLGVSLVSGLFPAPFDFSTLALHLGVALSKGAAPPPPPSGASS